MSVYQRVIFEPRFVKEGGFTFKEWALDETLDVRLEKVTAGYLDLYTPFGFSSEAIPRVEASDALHAIQDEPEKKLVIITGQSGVGKSGVVRQIIEGLRKSAVPCLAFRIDRFLEGGGPSTAEDLASFFPNDVKVRLSPWQGNMLRDLQSCSLIR